MRKPDQRPLERAFELARTGQFKTKSLIATAMLREGFSLDEVAQLYGRELSRQLRMAARAANPQAARPATAEHISQREAP